MRGIALAILIASVEISLAISGEHIEADNIFGTVWFITLVCIVFGI